MRLNGLILAAVAGVSAIGCGDAVDGMMPALDAGFENADASVASDGSVVEAPDAGTTLPDTGFGSPDAVAVDAGFVDAQPPHDSGAIADAATADSGFAADAGGPVARDLAITIDRDIDTAPTPINQLYVSEIASTVAGDRIISYQKYFNSEPMNAALVEAARRGVDVLGIYRDSVEPSCESLLEAGDTIDCDALFINSSDAHHKNMMILRADGTVRGIVGSYNPRLRNVSDPRVHTVLTFTVSDGESVFDFYAAEAERLQGGSPAQPVTMSMPIDGGGDLELSFHPGSGNRVLDLLNSINSCDSTLWLSYFVALGDSIGGPVFDRLEELIDSGCDVRFLLDKGNTLVRLALLARGIDARIANFMTPDGTLGHKIVLVQSGGEYHLIQSSANLEIFGFNLSHNLTAYVRAPSLPLVADIEAELSRYW